MTNPKTNSQWEDSRVEEYQDYRLDLIFGRHSTLWNYSKKETVKKVKQFISNLLHQRDMEIIKRIKQDLEALFTSHLYGENNFTIDDILKLDFFKTDAINEIKSHGN